MKKLYFILLICIAVSGFGCTEKGTHPALRKLNPSAYPQFQDDMNYERLNDAISQSLVYLKKIPADRAFQFGTDSFSAAHIIRSLEYFLKFIEKKPSSGELQEFIQANYLVYQSVGAEKDGKVLFTGYFEPILEGSQSETEDYPYPIYGEPDDLAVVDLSLFSPEFKGKTIIGRVEGKTFVPYHDREEMDDEDALRVKAPVLSLVHI